MKSQIIHDFLDNLPIFEGELGFLHLFINKCIAYYPLRPPTLDHNQKKTFFRKRYPRKAGNQDKDGRALYNSNEANCAKPRPPWMIREMSQNFVCAQRVIKNTKLSRFEMNSIMHEGKSDFMSGQLAFSGLMQNTMVPAIYNFIWD